MLVGFGSCYASSLRKGESILQTGPAGTCGRCWQARSTQLTSALSQSLGWWCCEDGSFWRAELSFKKIWSTKFQIDLVGSLLLTDGKVKMEIKFDTNWMDSPGLETLRLNSSWDKSFPTKGLPSWSLLNRNNRNEAKQSCLVRVGCVEFAQNHVLSVETPESAHNLQINSVLSWLELRTETQVSCTETIS